MEDPEASHVWIVYDAKLHVWWFTRDLHEPDKHCIAWAKDNYRKVIAEQADMGDANMVPGSIHIPYWARKICPFVHSTILICPYVDVACAMWEGTKGGASC